MNGKFKQIREWLPTVITLVTILVGIGNFFIASQLLPIRAQIVEAAFIVEANKVEGDLERDIVVNRLEEVSDNIVRVESKVDSLLNYFAIKGLEGSRNE